MYVFVYVCMHENIDKVSLNASGVIVNFLKISVMIFFCGTMVLPCRPSFLVLA